MIPCALPCRAVPLRCPAFQADEASSAAPLNACETDYPEEGAHVVHVALNDTDVPDSDDEDTVAQQEDKARKEKETAAQAEVLSWQADVAEAVCEGVRTGRF